MSHQTGITASKALLDLFARCKDGSVRLLQVLIEEERLVPGTHCPPRGTWERDYEELVPPKMGKEPCYILFRLDTTKAQGPEWVLIAWSPENAPIRQKMLYAATRATLKNEFGGGHIKSEIHATQLEDATLQGYQRHLDSTSAPAPLTAAEQELQQLKIGEAQSNVQVDTRRPTFQGLAFPIEDKALAALQRLKQREVSYVQLRLDTEREVISLEQAGPMEVGMLPAQVPATSPRWHFFLYRHSHEGRAMQSLVFIYSMPGSNCSIRERMLYSSCKAPFISSVERELGLEIARKVEIDKGSELTADFLHNELYPPQHVSRPVFEKPPGPSRSRGPRRITRPAAEEDASS